MKTIYIVQCECPRGHKQTIEYVGERREIVEDFASILDGSSPWFVIDPRRDKHSQIGRCMVCNDGTKFKATVVGEEVK